MTFGGLGLFVTTTTSGLAASASATTIIGFVEGVVHVCTKVPIWIHSKNF